MRWADAGPAQWRSVEWAAEELRQQLPTPQLQPPPPGCADPPSLEEVAAAVKQLRNAAAAGEDGVTARMLKAAPAAVGWMHAVISLVWETGEAPVAWKRAVLVPLYKGKGDKRDADNTRGISLLSIAGKVYTIILAQRAAQQLEPELLEEQCGFRPNRGLVDAVFCLRQVMAQSEQRRLPLHMAFVDLKKAFDSVDRGALWQVLRVYGLHEHLIKLIISLHSGTQAAVRLNGTLGPWFDVTRGVRQGCVLAPLLFNVFIDFVVRQTIYQNPDCGTSFAFVRNGQWVPSTEASSACVRRVAALLYADYMVLMAESREGLQRFLTALDAACTSLGMTINAGKTKAMCMDWGSSQEQGVFCVAGGAIEVVESFKYLGSHVHCTGSLDTQVCMRISSAIGAFRRMQHFWGNRRVGVCIKARVYKACVLPALLFAAEAWPQLTASQLHRLEVCQNDYLRMILGVRRADRHSTSTIRAACGDASIVQQSLEGRFRWMCPILRIRVVW